MTVMCSDLWISPLSSIRGGADMTLTHLHISSLSYIAQVTSTYSTCHYRHVSFTLVTTLAPFTHLPTTGWLNLLSLPLQAYFIYSSYYTGSIYSCYYTGGPNYSAPHYRLVPFLCSLLQADLNTQLVTTLASFTRLPLTQAAFNQLPTTCWPVNFLLQPVSCYGLSQPT